MQVGETTQVLPRADWKTHPNYSSQVLLLGSHDNFRRISAQLVTESMRSWSEAASRAPVPGFFRLFRRWKAAMKNHEAYEEGKLYPYLHARYGVDLETLRHQHRQLSGADTAVRRAHEAQDALQVAHAFKQHDEILVSHLAQEEDLVIPLLLGMPSAEFQRYSHGDIQSLLETLTR